MADADFESEVEIGDDEKLIVDVDGFEGPLDLLLELARRQKVDLQRVSILALAEQYLAFVETAHTLRLELAADYLVMAAWLAFLKSRLLLPRIDRDEEPEAGELAAALAERLSRLETIRRAAESLEARPRMGRDLLTRGTPDIDILEGGPPIWTATIYDLLSAYARQRQKQAASRMTIKRRVVWSFADAREALRRLVGVRFDWTDFDHYLLAHCTTPALRRTVRASAFSVTLELVKDGRISLRQDRAFSPLWMKSRNDTASSGRAAKS